MFLKYLIDEEIYIVDEKQKPIPSINAGHHKEENRSGDTEDAHGIHRSVNDEQTAKAGRSPAAVRTSEVNGSKDKVDVAEVGRTIAEGQSKDQDRSRDTEGDTKEISTAVGKYTKEGIRSSDDKSAKRYQNATVLLLDYEDQASMPPEHSDLLTKILQSVNLNTDSVEMVYRDEFDNLEVKDFTDCHLIAFLTLVPENISTLFSEKKYMIKITKGNQCIFSDTFNDLIKDRSLKRKLWEQLKLIYGL